MYATFDEKTKVLSVGKLNTNHEFKPYEDSDAFIAYKKYFMSMDTGPNAFTLQRDFKDLITVAKQRLMNSGNAIIDVNRIKFGIATVRYGDTNYRVGNYEYRATTVFARIVIDGETPDELKEVPILRFPYMNRYGIIEKDGMEYSVNSALEPSKYITYDDRLAGRSLDLMLHASKLSFTGKTSKNSISMSVNKSKNKYDLLQLTTFVAYIMKELQTVGPDGLFKTIKLDYVKNEYNSFVPDIEKELSDVYVTNVLELMQKPGVLFSLQNYGIVAGDEGNMFMDARPVLLEMFGFGKNPEHLVNPYALEDLRDELNEVLSIDRALGRVLARDIVITKNKTDYYVPEQFLPKEVIAKAGDLFTEDVLMKCNIHHINKIFVVRRDELFRKITAVAVEVKKIPKGFVLNKVLIRAAKGRLDSMPDVMQNDYYFGDRECIIDNYIGCNSQLIEVVTKCECRYLIFDSLYGAKEIPDELRYTVGYKILDSSEKEPKVHSAIYCWKNSEAIEDNKDNSKKRMEIISLIEAIVGNMHFKNDDNEWYYYCKDENGQFHELPSSPLLTFYDFLSLVSFLPELYNGNYIEKLAHKDLGMRKKVATIDAQFHRVIREKLQSQMSYMIYDAVYKFFTNEMPEKGKFASNAPLSVLYAKLSKACKAFYMNLWAAMGSRNYKYYKLVDKSNPFSYVSSINQIPTLTKSAHGVADSQRFMSMGFYGRICGFETPASGKLGLTNNVACRAIIRDHKIYTPYYRLIKQGDKIRVPLGTEPEYLTIEQEEMYKIADIMSLNMDENGYVDGSTFVTARVPSVDKIEKQSLECIPVYMVDYVNVFPDQTLGHVATTIPFIGSVDATRVTYGLSMAKQAVPIVHREIPRVVTDGFQDILWKTEKYQINAEADGTVEIVSFNMHERSGASGRITITVRYDVPIRPCERGDYFNSRNELDRYYETYVCLMAEFSDKCVITRKVEVTEGQRVKKGDVLVSSNYTKDGYIAIGVNALVAEIPTGYNYEDGVHISVRMKDKLTSYSRKNHTFKAPCAATTRDLNSMVYITYNNEYIFRWLPKSADVELKDRQRFAASSAITGFPVSLHTLQRRELTKKTKELMKEVESIEIAPMGEGDKVANRHGNKGVDAIIQNNSDMFCLDNGEFFDVVYDPNGVASRMNPAQLIEMPIALVAYIHDCHIQYQSYNEGDLSDIYDLYYYLWRCIEDGPENAVAPSWIPENFKRYLLTQVSRSSNWKGILDEDGRARVYDPIKGEYLKSRVYIGVNYVYKLVQISEHKMNARGGPLTDNQSYKLMDGRPDKGASVTGGQSIGYMEMAALLAHGADELFREIQHERGDNVAARQISVIDHLVGDNDDSTLANSLRVYKGELKHMQERRSVTKFKALMAGLGVDIQVLENKEGYPIVSHEMQEYEDNYYLRENYLKGRVRERVSDNQEEEYKSKPGLLGRYESIEDDGME